MKKENKILLFVIFVFGFFIRLLNLNQSLWLDEAITALAVKSNSFVEIITKYSPGDFHPPLYYLILKLWSIFFGFGEITLRFPSVVLGSLAIIVIYFLVRKVKDERAAILASVFMAINPLAVYYSQEARMYTMAMSLLLLSVYFFLSKRWLLFVFTYVLCLYTDYVPIFMFPVFVLWAIKDIKPLIKYFVLTIILLLPLSFLLINQLLLGFRLAGEVPVWSKIVGGFDLKSLMLVPLKFSLGRISFDNKIIYGFIGASVISFYSFLCLRGRNTKLFQWLLIPVVISILVSLFIPIFSYFRFLFVLPAFIILLAIGVNKSRITPVLIILISLASLTYFNFTHKFDREDWRGFVSMVDSKPGYILMPNLAQSAPIKYYNSNLALGDVTNFNLVGKERVYLLRYVQEVFDPEDQLQMILLNQGYTKLRALTYNSLLVWEFVE